MPPDTQTRRIKPSAVVLGEIARANALLFDSASPRATAATAKVSAGGDPVGI